MTPGPPSSVHSVDGPITSGLADVPLFHAAWLFAAGIIMTQWVWMRPSITLMALACTALVCIVAALRAERIAWLPLGLLWILLGAWCAEVEPYPVPAQSVSALSDGLMRTVEGTIVNTGPVRSQIEQNVDEDEQTAPTQAIDLRVDTIEQANDDYDRQIPATGTVRLTVRWSKSLPQPLRCGDRISADARLLVPTTYHDPGAWSRADYLLDQGITSTASLPAENVRSIGSPNRPPLSCRLTTLQQSATARLLGLPAATARMPQPLRLSTEDAIMLAAMVAGDRSYLSHSMRIGFERTGSFHMLVVSGFHLAIVAGCIFWIVRRLRLPQIPATLFTIAGSFAYAVFTGFATPVQRSFWMVTLYLIGRLFYRDRRPMNVIGFAALCLLGASPRSLFESGFQMTLLAVVAIAGIAVPLLQATVHAYSAAIRDLRLTAIDSRIEPRLAAFRVFARMVAVRLRAITTPFVAWRLFPWSVRAAIRIVELVVVSVVVELAMALPMAVNFHRITIVALPVNLLILPLLSVLMPAALLTIALLITVPSAAILPAAVVALALHFGVGLIHFFGAMQLGDFRIPTPAPMQIAAFWLLLSASIALAGYAARPRFRWAAAFSMLLAACAAVAPRHVDRPRGQMLVESIDVGQGDSLLLITPDGKTLLVDAGGFGGPPRPATREFDIGEEVVSTALWSRGIRHLDAVALSHAHSDHMGGMGAVLRNFHPDELWVGNNPRVQPYLDLLNESDALHTHVRSFRAGDAFQFGAAQVAVLAPTADYRPAGEPANNDSLVLHIAYADTSILLEGDAEQPIEQAMLAEPGLRSTLLKVGHHGSVSSTSPEFLSRVAPQWAVISCGLNNRFRHPRSEILAALQEAHTRTFRTDIDGASCFILDGKSAKPDYGCGWRSTE